MLHFLDEKTVGNQKEWRLQTWGFNPQCTEKEKKRHNFNAPNKNMRHSCKNTRNSSLKQDGLISNAIKNTLKTC